MMQTRGRLKTNAGEGVVVDGFGELYGMRDATVVTD